MELKRSSGILLHISSLPSDFGIGDIGPAAYGFIDFLKASGHHYWQILPLNPTHSNYSHSPYSSSSAFAGNPLFISPSLLEEDGFLKLREFPVSKESTPEKVNFKEVEKYKTDMLEMAFQNFKKKKLSSEAFISFCKNQASWLEDFSLFMALRSKFGNNWTCWPKELKNRRAKALKDAREEFAEIIEKEKFIQFLFFFQWKKLVDYAHKNQVNFIGDIPFYINHDSVDCWVNSGYFKLDEDKQPEKISGVPPDFFSETGQLWGTPVFDWKALKKNNFDWWVDRIRQNLLLFDLVRLDHFRAFSAYWEVPAGDNTAINGKWITTPGAAFFRILKKEFPKMPLIAEDLGSLDEEVYKLMDRFNFPGMKVLHFAFGEDRTKNPYLPFNHSPHNFVYTGTHDNNTSRGWYERLSKTGKVHLKDYSGVRITSKNVHRILHRMLLNSVARVAVIPMQDIIGLGEEAMMNTPGTTKGNWTWRITYEQIPLEKSVGLKALNVLYGREI